MKELTNMKYFLYVGSAYPHKNLEGAIKAAAKLRVQFYIVSSRNIFEKRLRELTDKLNAKDFVKFLGYVSDEELKKLYKNSVGFIYPSLSEGFGLPGLEAMKTGTLVLCSDIAIFKEIYGENAFYFNPMDDVSIEKAMEKVLELDTTLRAKRIKKAQEFVKKYSWEKMARETLKVYTEVLF